MAAYSTALAGLGGALYASLYSITPEIGSGYILKGVEAAILAGIGSVMGSFAGGIIIGVAEGVGSIFLASAYNDAYGLVFLVNLILLFKPAGLFGGRRMKAWPLWIALLAVPALTGNNAVLTILIFTFILGILAVSFNLIFGFTGQLSLFHAAASFGLVGLRHLPVDGPLGPPVLARGFRSSSAWS